MTEQHSHRPDTAGPDAFELGDDAVAYFDAETDPAHPTWVLRYTNSAGRALIEVLTIKDPTATAQAVQEAREFLSTNVTG